MQTTCAVKGHRLNCCWISARRRRPRRLVGNLFALAEQVFLLRFVELLQRQRGGFDVENQFGHRRALFRVRLCSPGRAEGRALIAAVRGVRISPMPARSRDATNVPCKGWQSGLLLSFGLVNRSERSARTSLGPEGLILKMSLLAGKTGVVFGVANRRSIAWAIAQAWHAAGAKLAFTYQGER